MNLPWDLTHARRTISCENFFFISTISFICSNKPQPAVECLVCLRVCPLQAHQVFHRASAESRGCHRLPWPADFSPSQPEVTLPSVWHQQCPRCPRWLPPPQPETQPRPLLLLLPPPLKPAASTPSSADPCPACRAGRTVAPQNRATRSLPSTRTTTG
jgi:hypothetical protein